MRLDWTCRRVDAVTLVALRLENDAEEPRRVRVENRLDGPVRPPRRGGRPAAGWGSAGYEGVLDPGETRALGYACPAPPVDPPTAVEESRAPPDANGNERASGSDSQSAGGVVAALGDPRPPRDAVPTPRDGAEAGAAADAAPDSDPDPNRDPNPGPERAGASANASTAARTASDGGSDVSGVSDSRGAGAEPPAPVTDWLDDVTGRIESGALAPGEERALAVVGERIAAVQVAVAERRRR